MPITPAARLVILLGLTLLATGVLTLPILRYVYIGWWAKRAEILYVLTPESRLRYFEMFERHEKYSLAEAREKLDQFYRDWYGRRLYVTPLLFLVLTTLVMNDLSISSALAIYADGSLLPNGTIHSTGFAELAWIPIAPLGIAAQAGAYMWVVNDYTSRARRLDLAPSDIHWGVLRLVIALPLGCYASEIVPGHAASLFVAFAVGAFPLSSLLSLFRRLFFMWLGIQDNVTTGNDIIKLQGVNPGIAERLANEDITTIAQLAYCDPIRITMRSSLSFNFIIDCMNQALAWVYLEGGMNTIRPFGLRGAVEINHFYQRLTSDDPNTKAAAQAALSSIQAALKQDNATLMMVFFEIARDPFTEYLSSIWDSLETDQQAASHRVQTAIPRSAITEIKQDKPDDIQTTTAESTL